jgi:acyl transferase domain-containing protein/NADPH:quinone reductase-like Zn-dependent oxidoreductase/SAM-dependent methyltransferase/acyl carrier protein
MDLPVRPRAYPRMQKEGIAIIGIGCRFPGGVNDAEALWNLLAEGREAVGEVPSDRWNVERFYDAEPGLAGKSIAKRGGFLHGIDQFDPQFFGISPREAPYVDPQHRLLLETAWEAIEDAGLVLDFDRGTDLAVFVGISHNDYQGIQGTPWDSAGITSHSPTGSAHSIAANRISYCLNLQGPSVALDTACSSALTAVHTACEYIWAGRGVMALAGGVTVMITPGGFIGFSQASMLSPEGRCKAFDASADGFVRGEGAGMVLLKRLSQAVADGDPIHGVVLGTAMNQDGHTNGISLPSPEAQARLVRDACADAGIEPSQIGFVEAHGTGTAVGDPIEAHALAEALCANRPAESPLLIGSVKTNLGHLETAAGIAGLLKAVLVLKYSQVPASLHFRTPNPHIDFTALKLRVPTALEPFPASADPRVASVNSFGFGGANTHVVLTGPPTRPHPEQSFDDASRAWPLVLSARSEASLRASAGQLAAWIDEHLRSNGNSPLLADLTYTLGARRNHHPHRLSLVARTPADAIREFNDFAAGLPVEKLRTAFAPRREGTARVAFVMSGQGPQWWGMGRELMQQEPVFRRAIESCDAALRPWTRFSLREELGGEENASQIHRTEIAQPAIFALQVGLAELWKSWGVLPAAVVGHSVGEVAAAYVAGALDLEQAARVIALRSRLMEDCARGKGTMLAVGLAEEDLLPIIARHLPTVGIAAFNGPRSLTLSGPRTALESIAAEVEAQGMSARFVRVDHPFHHPLMQPASEALEEALTDLTPQTETVPFFSTVTGQRCRGDTCGAAHWGRGVRQPVQFYSAVNALAEFGAGVWLEINAHPALGQTIKECLTARGNDALVLASTRRQTEHQSVLETAMELHRSNVELQFEALTPSRNLLSLPAYAWDKSRWWHEASDWREGRLAPGGLGLLDVRLPRATPTWIARLDGRHMAYLKDHVVENHVVFPAAAFVEMILEAGVQLFEGRSFVVEDLEIRKPLLIPDPPSQLLLELSYDPEGRTFAIQSRQRAAWSLHVVGSLRAERTDSAFSASSFGRPANLSPVAVENFYTHLSDLGLRYGNEFRPVHELWADAGESAGRVFLSDVIARRAGEYSLHPVLLDGALHVLSAAAATVETKGGMKLPVRLARIHFLRSPGASCLARATVRQFNDELIEGDIGLYDEGGKPCVRVDGFRAISMAAALRSHAPEPGRDLIYHIEWVRTPTGGRLAPQQPLPLDRLQAVGADCLEKVIRARGRAELEATLAAEDELAAIQLAAGLKSMGAGERFTADSLGVAEPMRAIFARLVNGLVSHRLLDFDGVGYRPATAFASAANSAPEALRSFISDHPGHLSEGLLCATTCAELGAILRGDKDAVQVLFGGTAAELLDQFYGDSLFAGHWLASITSVVCEAARHLPEGRGFRILELGAGTGGLTAYLLPLLERGLHSYVFSDVSPAFFAGAMQKLALFPEVEYKVFDVERSGLDQDFEAGAFDFVVGTNVLHAAADVRIALKHIYELLAPGGTLLFMDLATPQLWTESVFGLTSGWWRFADRDLRPDHPLLQRAQWEAVLRETGFSETASLPGLRGPRGGEGQIGLLARKRWSFESESEFEWKSTQLSCFSSRYRAGSADPYSDSNSDSDSDSKLSPPSGTAGEPDEKSWAVFADASGLGDELAARLRAAGIRCRVAHPGDQFAPVGPDAFTLRVEAAEDYARLLAACKDNAPPERLVWMWSLDEPAQDIELQGTCALLQLAQAIESTMPVAKLRIDLITRGAQPVGSQPIVVAQAPIIGLFRVVLNEHPHLAGRCIDLSPIDSDSNGELLWRELLRSDAEREVALRGESRYVQRLTRGLPAGEQWLEPTVPLRLESRERGHLDSLRFAPFALPACGPGEVLVEVKAAGVNFRDVLKALTLYPAESRDARIFGDEVAGIVLAVGAGIEHVAVGDRVFGLAVFGLATHTLARAGDVRKIPDGLTFEEAATLPVAFLTAWHALKKVAGLRKDERILIHAGAGGVGMAAIQIAQHLGAQIVATAGGPAKRALLETLGVRQVIDSRRADFADAVLEMTGGRGVDVVLNSLAGEAIPMGLSCLAEFGRFVEIGKRDIYQNARIPLWPLRRNASFHVVAMDAVFNRDAEFTRQLLEEIATMVEEGAIRPLPFRPFPACRIDAAFRLMAQGKHTGKVVVAFCDPFVPRRGKPPLLKPAFQVRSDGNYLVTGAFGGFGRVLAMWLVNCGVRHLVLASRGGAATPESEAWAEQLRERGAEVQIVQADVGSPEDVTRLITRVRASETPLRGVFHLAMAIDDAPLAALTRERMRAVMAPKAVGARLLHEATRDLKLDCFVMFSSVSSIFGNPAQGNYAAANAFLDALAYHRRALGLPALTINWGVLGGAGYVARNERVAEFLARQGTLALSPGEVVTMLESFLTAGVNRVAAIRVDWAKWRQSFRSLQENPLLERVFGSRLENEQTGSATDWRHKIASAAPADREQIIGEAVRGIICSVLRVKPENLRDDQPLTDLGLDSLMGAEIEASIENAIGIGLPPASLMRARTIGQIRTLIAEHMNGTPVAGTAAPSVEPVAEPSLIDAVNLDALSNEEVTRLIGDDGDRAFQEPGKRSNLKYYNA